MSLASAVLVSVHVLAAVVWIGGMGFLSLVLAPLVRSGSVPESPLLFRAAALRFRPIVWSAIALLLATGPLLLHQRGIPLVDPGQWPTVLRVKLGLVGLLLLLTFSHDLLLGPRVSRINAMPASDRTAHERLLLRTSRWLPRLALLLALAIIIAAILLARS